MHSARCTVAARACGRRPVAAKNMQMPDQRRIVPASNKLPQAPLLVLLDSSSFIRYLFFQWNSESQKLRKFFIHWMVTVLRIAYKLGKY